MSFFTSLTDRINKIDSLLCIGLDPHMSQLSEPTVVAAETFCMELIAATLSVAAAYKPNIAFFEAFGASGLSALERVIAHIPNEIPVLLDAKRGDIFTTAEAYRTAAFDVLKAQAITLAPYMGKDSISPFIEDASKGCFVLCKTSNPSSNDMQTLRCSRGLETMSKDSARYLYEEVALLAATWNTHDNVGLVVGATDVEALRRVRQIVPETWILAPGIGAQGGNLEEAVAASIRKDGKGLLIPVSRGVSKAENPGQAARDFRDAINAAVQSALTKTNVPTINNNAMEFIEFALSLDVLRFGEFTLKSGRKSPYFFNAGLFNSGQSLSKLGRFYAQTIHESGIEFDVIFGPAYKGITLAASISIAYYEMYYRDIPYAYNRKEAKDHGEGGVLVGASMKGKRVLIVDDVITAGTAIGEAMTILKDSDAIPVGVCISLDRQEKLTETTSQSAVDMVEAKYNLKVISIASLSNLKDYLQQQPDQVEQFQQIEKYQQTYGI